MGFVVAGIEMKKRVEDGKRRRKEGVVAFVLLLLEVMEELVEVDSSQKGIQRLEPEASYFWRERFARFPRTFQPTFLTPYALSRSYSQGWRRREGVG